MFLTQTNEIRKLTKAEYHILKELCSYANNLYNAALYQIRQYYFVHKKFLPYESNYHVCKDNENYGLLQAGISQQILRVADRSFKSFFNLIKKAKNNEYRFQNIQMPHYRKKGGLMPLILSANAIAIKDGMLKLPLSRKFREQHPDADISIPVPERLHDKKIKEIRILPCHSGKYFKIQYVYEQKTEDLHLNPENTLAIDIGVDNLAACVSNTGSSFLMDGRKLKSINQHWNKETARLKSILMKQYPDRYLSKRIQNLTKKRNNRVKDIIRKTARYILNYCISHNIGTVVVGYTKDFKRSVNMGKTNNQQFVNIPFGELRETLRYLCERYGMQYMEIEESYTSKSSFLDHDPLPEYNPEQPYTGNFSGKRIKRGLYRAKNGIVLNADIHGACNILRKSKQNFHFEELCKGLLNSPVRILVV